VLKAGIAGAATLPMPRLARADTLLCAPQADPARPDPGQGLCRPQHAFRAFDTLECCFCRPGYCVSIVNRV
jgi:hypothetical protein